MHIEQFVMENLNEHRKGILGKTMPVSHMLSWTKVCRPVLWSCVVCSLHFDITCTVHSIVSVRLSVHSCNSNNEQLQEI